jgi:hypothetical protein
MIGPPVSSLYVEENPNSNHATTLIPSFFAALINSWSGSLPVNLGLISTPVIFLST